MYSHGGFERSSCCTLQFTSTELLPLHNFQKWDSRCRWAYSFGIGEVWWMDMHVFFPAGQVATITQTRWIKHAFSHSCLPQMRANPKWTSGELCRVEITNFLAMAWFPLLDSAWPGLLEPSWSWENKVWHREVNPLTCTQTGVWIYIFLARPPEPLDIIGRVRNKWSFDCHVTGAPLVQARILNLPHPGFVRGRMTTRKYRNIPEITRFLNPGPVFLYWGSDEVMACFGSSL